MFDHELATRPRFPETSIREAVLYDGDVWFTFPALMAHAHKLSTLTDSTAMRVQEELRRAGATPAQRVKLFERRQQIKHGEVLS